MRCDFSDREPWICSEQRARNGNKYFVLAIAVIGVVIAFEFDADRKIVTAAPAAKKGIAGVPGTMRESHELNQFTAAPNQQMRRDLETSNFIEVRMAVPVEGIRKQLFYFGTSELTWRQADAMHDEQFRDGIVRPLVVIGARALPRRLNEPTIDIDAERITGQWLPLLPGKTIVMSVDADCQRQWLSLDYLSTINLDPVSPCN